MLSDYNLTKNDIFSAGEKKVDADKDIFNDFYTYDGERYTYVYRFITGERKSIPVPPNVFALLRRLDKRQYNSDDKQRRHCVKPIENLSDKEEEKYAVVSGDISDDLIIKEEIAETDRAIGRLTPKQANILKRLYGDEISQRKYAEENGIAECSVSLLRKKALEHLSAELRDNYKTAKNRKEGSAC